MRNITLPTGPYDWHDAKVSRRIYEARLEAFRDLAQSKGLTGAIVSGSTFDDGALAWLTGFTPKLGPAYVLVPMAGTPRLLFSGGPGMRPSAQRLTWIEDVVALKGLPRDLAAWDCPKPWGLVEDAGLSAGSMTAITQAHGTVPLDLTTALNGVRQLPEDVVKPLIRRGAAVLGHIEAKLLQTLSPTRWEARLAAEQVAFDHQAQDLRLRLSAVDGGPPEPIDPDDTPMPRQAAIAIALRVEGYWFFGHGWRGHPPASADAGVLAQLKPGTIPATLGIAHIAAIGHSLIAPAFDAGQPLVAGQCLHVTLAASGGPPLSALVEIGPAAPRLLWVASGLTGGRP